MKILVSLLVLFGAFSASADWEEQQKQNQAVKLFKASSTAQALKNPKFAKVWPTVHFADVKRYSSTHDDCISGDSYIGGFSTICTAKEDVYVNEEGDGEPGEWKTVCTQHAKVNLVKPASQAPTSVKVIFYRKVSGVSDYKFGGSQYRVGSADVAIPACN